MLVSVWFCLVMLGVVNCGWLNIDLLVIVNDFDLKVMRLNELVLLIMIRCLNGVMILVKVDVGGV